MKKRIALLGATGSIGTSTLDVMGRCKDDFDLVLLSAHSRGEGLEKAGREWSCRTKVLSGGFGGKEKLLAAIAAAKADIVINGISGAAGLEPSIAALESGADLALANKETLVMAGKLVSRLAASKSIRILPVDSEHSAVFHLIAAHGAETIDEILLTASGGPFRIFSRKEMENISPEAALAHPTWKMGSKITIDSASMANKGLEVIEAARLFNLSPEKIKVVIHPQSIVHSMIRLRSGAVYAQLSQPDMRFPIHAALYWPDVQPAFFDRLDFDSLRLTFERPDMEQFPMLDLAYRALRQGGLYTCAYNAANEVAVAAFLDRKIGFLDIPKITDYVLSRGWNREADDIAAVLEADTNARTLALSYISSRKHRQDVWSTNDGR